MRIRWPALLSLVVLVAVTPPAAAQQANDALVILAAGANVSQELADDITEAAGFSIAKETELRFVPKEMVTAKLGYQSPANPGACIFDNECLRKVHLALKTRTFIVGRLSKSAAGFKITIVSVGKSAALDVTVAGDSPGGASEAINKTRALVIRSLKTPIATFVFSVNEPDAVIELGGKKVGTGSTTVKVKPGTYRVRVTKPGFAAFDAKLQCTAEQQCVIPINIVKKQVDVPRPDPNGGKKPVVAPDNTPRILQITGWSAVGVGVAMTVVGVVYGLQAADAQSELDAACATQPCTVDVDRARELADQGDTGAAVFNGVGITGIALTAAGATVAIIGHVMQPKKAGKGSIEVTPSVGPSGSVWMRATVRF